MRKFLKNEQGFTLVELMLVVAVIAILAAVLIPKMANVKNTARETGVAGNVRTIESYAVSMIDKYPDGSEGAKSLKLDLIKKLGDLVNPISKLTQTGTNDPPGIGNGTITDANYIKPVAYSGSDTDSANLWATTNNSLYKGVVGVSVFSDANGLAVELTPFDSKGLAAANSTEGIVTITKTKN